MWPKATHTFIFFFKKKALKLKNHDFLLIFVNPQYIYATCRNFNGATCR